MILDPGRPVFPPLFAGVAAPTGMAAGDYAREMAVEGCDGGTVVHDVGSPDLTAAVVFAPDVCLRDAAAMLPLCAIGLADALGALAPPEVSLRLTWDGGILVNGAECGALAISASTARPEAVPDWLVVEIAVPFPPDLDEMGHAPGRTALHAEGCGEITPLALLEAWIRHCLVRLHQWTDEDTRALERRWSELGHRPGDEIAPLGRPGVFLGVDEHFGLLLETRDGTVALPLTMLLADHG